MECFSPVFFFRRFFFHRHDLNVLDINVCSWSMLENIRQIRYSSASRFIGAARTDETTQMYDLSARPTSTHYTETDKQTVFYSSAPVVLFAHSSNNRRFVFYSKEELAPLDNASLFHLIRSVRIRYYWLSKSTAYNSAIQYLHAVEPESNNCCVLHNV